MTDRVNMADPTFTPEQMSLPPAAAAGRRRSSKRKPSADTIEVKQKFSSITLSSSDDEDVVMQDEVSRQLVNEASAARGKGKVHTLLIKYSALTDLA